MADANYAASEDLALVGGESVIEVIVFGLSPIAACSDVLLWWSLVRLAGLLLSRFSQASIINQSFLSNALL